MDGVLVVDKPAGLTSFAVVRKLRSLGRGRKAGHTGTLDPAATGVLVVCLGNATKLSNFLLEGEKTYQGVIRLGVETDTYDSEGQVVSESDPSHLSEEEVRRAVAAVQGVYWQTPPMHSAVKVEGKRLYELARKGEEIERKPRKVEVREIETLAWEPPDLEIRLTCSKGTYVRSIAHELGQSLDVGGHLASLRRLKNGPFTIEQAIPLATLEEWIAEKRLDEVERHLISPRDALCELREVRVDDLRARKVARGMTLGSRDLALSGAPHLLDGERVRITGPGLRLLAIAEQRDGALRYLRVFVTP